MPATKSPRRAPRRADRRTRNARAEGVDARRALLDAAARVFASRGFRDASVDAIAQEAGFSKGALYWHFAGKDDLFFALLEERIDRPTHEVIKLLESAPAERDMAPEASRLFGELLERQADLFLLDHEYWSLAVRDPELRGRYAARQAELRRAFAGALDARMRHLGAPPFDTTGEEVATAFLGLAYGLARQKLVDPDAVPDHLLGEIFALVYAGLLRRAEARAD
jgi:AcrR family transcriptional regulator